MRYILVSQAGLYPEVKTVPEYVIYCTRNADPKSEFGKRTRELRELEDEKVLPALIAMGYDGLVFLKDGVDDVICHVFFQWRKTVPHMFSIGVDPHFQGLGYSRRVTKFFLEHLRKCGVKRFRFGGGNVRKELSKENWAKFEALHQRIISNRLWGLGFRVEKIPKSTFGWVRIIY